MGKGSFKFAHIFDTTNAERERGVTINIHTKQIYKGENGRRYTLIDTPGHIDFMNNAIKGIFMANAALVVVGATDGQ